MFLSILFARLSDEDGIHGPYSYWNGHNGFNDGSSNCKYDEKGFYDCDQTQAISEEP